MVGDASSVQIRAAQIRADEVINYLNSGISVDLGNMLTINEYWHMKSSRSMW